MQHCFLHQLVYIENLHRLQPVNRQLNETKDNKKNDRKKIQSDNVSKYKKRPLTLTELIRPEYDVTSLFVNFFAVRSISVSMKIIFRTNAFFSDILTPRLTTDFEAKINFGRDKLIA